MVLEIIGGFVAIVLVVLAVAYVISMYNQLVRLNRRVDQAKQNIDVLLKRRQDELTKLIDATREFMEHEEELLSALTEARERAEQARTPTEQASADQAIRDALAGFRARFEAYPELRSQTNMLQFQERISDVESQIADRREFYNEAATRYNTRIKQFPWVIVAKQLGYTERELFTATDEETADIDISEQFAAA
ncbi:LemA family protein [Halobacteriales archaeon QS_5_68_33]|nr:MAG: LemA family protein [Halobacteriales archaeon QS_5_68_33]